MTSSDAPGDRPDAPLVHAVTLAFAEFGWHALEAEAEREGETLDELVSRAVAYYDGELRTNRAALHAPRFGRSAQGSPREVRLELTRGCRERLESEAQRQDVPLERLLEHASLFYLADLDSGRVANRILGGDGNGEDEEA